MASRKNAHHTHYVLKFHPATIGGKPPVVGVRLHYLPTPDGVFTTMDFTSTSPRVTRIPAVWADEWVLLPQRPDGGSSYTRVAPGKKGVVEIFENWVDISPMGNISVEIVVTHTRSRYKYTSKDTGRRNPSGFYYVHSIKAEYFAVGYRKHQWDLSPCEGKRVRICNPATKNTGAPAVWQYLH